MSPDPTPNIAESSVSSTSRPRINPVEVLGVIWNKRKFVGFFVGTVSLLVAIISLLLAPSYISTATILPETDKSKLASLGNLSEIASLAGVNLSTEGSMLRLYPTIILSERVLRNVIYSNYQTQDFPRPVNLIQYWGLKDEKPGSAYFYALQALKNKLDVVLDNKTGVITISFVAPERKLAADIVNNVIIELDNYVRTERINNASEQRKFIEGRLQEVKLDLSNSENALKDFRERNRQVSASPELLLKQGRLERDLQLNNTLFIELKKQYEIARIEEVRNLPVINVLDEATPAVFRYSPLRTRMTIAAFSVSLILALAWVLIEHDYDTEIRKTLSQLKNIVLNSNRS